MTLPTFTPPFEPSAGLQAKPEIKVLKADFGDGYSQPTPDGLNHIREVLTLTWEGLERIERDQIITFMKLQKGTQPFAYSLPGDSAPSRFTCSDWSHTALGSDLWTVNATFKQDFGNAS